MESAPPPPLDAAPPDPNAAPPAVRPWLAGAGLLVIGVAIGFAAGVRVGSLRSPDPRPPWPHLVRAPPPDPPRPSELPLLQARHAGPALVNVWLQGCPDCMPKFEAWSRYVASGRLPRGCRVHNVAYGDATRAYAAQYRVDQGLAADAGGVYVKPLGIGTFTTLLVDADGKVLERLDPTAESFAAKVSLFVETRCMAPPGK